MRSHLLSTGLLTAFLLLPFAAQASRYCPYRVCHSYDQYGVCNNYTCGDPIHYGGYDRYDRDYRCDGCSYDRRYDDNRYYNGERRYYYNDRYNVRRYPASYDWSYNRSYYYDNNYDSYWDRERLYVPRAGYYYRY